MCYDIVDISKNGEGFEMKIHKRLAKVLVAGMVISSSMNGLCAKETQMNQEAKRFSMVRNAVYATTTSGAITVSNAKTKTIDDKMCLIVRVITDNAIKSVTIDGKTATKYSGNSTNAQYYIEITSGGTYEVVVKDSTGKESKSSFSITLDDKEDPELELSQKIKNGVCYLVIKASDNVAIDTVKVDDKTISFSSSGGTVEHKVTSSGEYKVEVKDTAGNKTTKRFDVDINAKTPSLTLDKIYKNNQWNLIIEAYPNGNADISKVTVNGKTVSCKKAGEKIEYPVSGTATYKVIVTDNYGQKAEKSLYIDTKAIQTAYEPSLTVSQANVGNIIYLVITAKPNTQITDNKLSKVTVNGVDINMSGAGGTVRYPVSGAGTYAIVATDIKGNEKTQTYNALPISAQTNAPSSKSSNVVFTLNQKTWTQNGVSQQMDAAPKIRNGRIYIPIRYVAYALNIDSSKVGWDAKTQTVTIYDGSNTVKVPLDSKTMTVNGVSQAMDAAAFNDSGRVYIPISQVAKAFSGVNMQWDNVKKQVSIQR